MFVVPIIQALEAPRQPNFVRECASTTEPVERNVRLTIEQLREIILDYHQWRRGRNNRVRYFTSEKRMETYLNFLSSGGYYRQISFSCGIATSTGFHHTHEVADFFMNIAHNFISLPTPDEYNDLSLQLEDVDGQMKRVILYIDGVIIRIQRPDHAGDAYFCGRHGKSCDSINVQYVVDKFGMIRHVVTGVSGATHDKTATEWSAPFMNFLDTLPPDVVVLGDPAYRNLHASVKHSFTGNNLPVEQRLFNTRCRQLRQIVERTIGATELKWRIDQLKENRYPAKAGVEFASMCTIAACVLHNRFTNFL